MVKDSNENRDNYQIKHFPISFFSIILGLSGYTIAFQKSEQIVNLPIHLSQYLLWLSLVLFGVISAVYLAKILSFRDQVSLEFDNPIKLSFFPTFSISLILFSIAFLPVNMVASKYFWIFGTIIQFLFTVRIISIWIQHTKFKIIHMNPAWFIPAVGNILVPVAGVSHFSPEISWFFYSIGLGFWVILSVIFFNRVIFHDPLPEKLLPTMFILIAPPAVGFISSVRLFGEVNDFGRMLYYFALFMAFLLFAQIGMFKKARFYLSWWAYSFPVAAMTVANILYFHESNYAFLKILSYLFFVLLSFVIIGLLAKTASAIYKREICVEE
jgi:tellurite resistance protein